MGNDYNHTVLNDGYALEKTNAQNLKSVKRSQTLQKRETQNPNELELLIVCHSVATWYYTPFSPLPTPRGFA